MKESWKDIIGYEGLYQVSSYGKIKSQDKILPSDGFHIKIHRKERILNGSKDRVGYFRVKLSKGCSVNKTFSLHRLVAYHFVLNPENKPEVNHKNGIKKDNRAHNLEWMTRGENQSHAYKTGLKNPSKSCLGGKHNPRSRPIFQVFNNGKIKKWWSIGEAAKMLNLSKGNIWRACNVGRCCGGFKWRYAS